MSLVNPEPSRVEVLLSFGVDEDYLRYLRRVPYGEAVWLVEQQVQSHHAWADRLSAFLHAECLAGRSPEDEGDEEDEVAGDPFEADDDEVGQVEGHPFESEFGESQ